MTIGIDPDDRSDIFQSNKIKIPNVNERKIYLKKKIIQK